MITDADVANRFTYHAPTPEQVEIYEHIRASGRAMAEQLLAATPPSREQSLAITHIEEAVFWANAALARST